MSPTLLFVDGHPVPYLIDPQGSYYHIYPFHDTHPEVVAPSLKAYRHNGRWTVEGCCCQNLYDQVVEELENLAPALS